jgi:hypothetical protein
MSHERSSSTNAPISRRSALRAGVAASAAMTVATAGSNAVMAQGATEHLEVEVVVSNPVTITRAGGGPPQRGDYFYIDGLVFASGDVGGAEIGRYNCFGAWTTAADDTSATYQRLTTVQFQLDDGSIMGLVNEGGADPNVHVGAIQGGTERYAGALGTFQQLVQGPVPGVATPEAAEATDATMAATPAPAGTLVHTVFELMLPAQG